MYSHRTSVKSVPRNEYKSVRNGQEDTELPMKVFSKHLSNELIKSKEMIIELWRKRIVIFNIVSNLDPEFLTYRKDMAKMLLGIIITIMTLIAVFMYLVILGASRSKSEAERWMEDAEQIIALEKWRKNDK